MDDMDLAIQVLNISPNTTRDDLNTFFSYCGTVDKIQLKRDNGHSQSAVVTFKQPYAVRTALLLNDALIGDRHVTILKVPKSTSIPIVYGSSKNFERPGGDLVTAAQSAIQVLTQKGNEAMNMAKETVKQTGRAVAQQACSAIITAEQTAGDISSSIMSSSCFSKGASWLSAALDRASKSVAELGGAKAQSPNFLKQK